MKNTTKIRKLSVFFSLSCLCFFFTSSCIESKLPSYSSNLVPVKTTYSQIETDLTALLRNVPELITNGVRQNAAIAVRNNIKVQSNVSSSPLFIIDGMEFGYDYANVYYRVDGNDIRSIRVLNDASALVTYGRKGENGAIIIQTAGM